MFNVFSLIGCDHMAIYCRNIVFILSHAQT
jgi:hypothetical protein